MKKCGDGCDANLFFLQEKVATTMKMNYDSYFLGLCHQ